MSASGQGSLGTADAAGGVLRFYLVALVPGDERRRPFGSIWIPRGHEGLSISLQGICIKILAREGGDHKPGLRKHSNCKWQAQCDDHVTLWTGISEGKCIACAKRGQEENGQSSYNGPCCVPGFVEGIMWRYRRAHAKSRLFAAAGNRPPKTPRSNGYSKSEEHTSVLLN